MYSLSSRADVVLEEDAKHLLFKIHCQRGVKAIDSAGAKRPLSECDVDNVKFIAGAWRIQNKFEHEIQIVRGKEFVLGEKIDNPENSLSEFYNARLVGRNYYGRYFIDGADTVVVKYETANRTYWGYRNTPSHRRAYMLACLYNKHR